MDVSRGEKLTECFGKWQCNLNFNRTLEENVSTFVHKVSDENLNLKLTSKNLQGNFL